MTYMEEIGARAQKASRLMNKLGQRDKNRGLIACAEALVKQQDRLIAANEEDIRRAKESGMKPSLVDRLMITPERIAGMAEGIRQVALLEDPIGEMISMVIVEKFPAEFQIQFVVKL